MQRNDSCLKFIYSPLKRIPVKQLNFVGSLADEDIYTESASDIEEKQKELLKNNTPKSDNRKPAEEKSEEKAVETPVVKESAETVVSEEKTTESVEEIVSAAETVEEASSADKVAEEVTDAGESTENTTE